MQITNRWRLTSIGTVACSNFANGKRAVGAFRAGMLEEAPLRGGKEQQREERRIYSLSSLPCPGLAPNNNIHSQP